MLSESAAGFGKPLRSKKMEVLASTKKKQHYGCLSESKNASFMPLGWCCILTVMTKRSPS